MERICLGKMLRQARGDRTLLSVSESAKNCGCNELDPPALSKIETSKSMPTHGQAVVIGNVYGIGKQKVMDGVADEYGFRHTGTHKKPSQCGVYNLCKRIPLKDAAELQRCAQMMGYDDLQDWLSKAMRRLIKSAEAKERKKMTACAGTQTAGSMGNLSTYSIARNEAIVNE